MLVPHILDGAAGPDDGSGVNRVLQIRDVRERLESLTFEPIGGTPQQFAEYVRPEVAKWAIVVKQTGAKVE
jgi:tripartite-type tricarboxylate transporter receptor subunit TctC